MMNLSLVISDIMREKSEKLVEKCIKCNKILINNKGTKFCEKCKERVKKSKCCCFW